MDTTDFDSNTFGNIPALTNGFTAGIRNGEFTRIFLVINNKGFQEHGLDFSSINKAPAGYYGFYEEMLFEKKFGAIPKLDGNMSEKFVFNVNDDLTAQYEMAVGIRLHYKTE